MIGIPRILLFYYFQIENPAETSGRQRHVVALNSHTEVHETRDHRDETPRARQRVAPQHRQHRPAHAHHQAQHSSHVGGGAPEQEGGHFLRFYCDQDHHGRSRNRNAEQECGHLLRLHDSADGTVWIFEVKVNV